MKKPPLPNLNRAVNAWTKADQSAPDWVLALAGQCDKSTQSDVARSLKVSPTLVNQVLGNVYQGDLVKIESQVRGVFMRAVVICPIAGEISTAKCVDYAGRRPGSTNPLRVLLAQACPACPHNPKRST